VASNLQTIVIEKFVKQSKQRQFNENIFHTDVLINNCKDSEIADMMANVIEAMTDREFLRYFTVSVGTALDVFEEEMSDLNPVVAKQPKGRYDDSDDDVQKSKKVELGISIMKCQPSSRNYCETTTADLFRLFQSNFLPQKKFGSISNFVCEFIQGKNGIIYFSQVKAFECDYKLNGEDVREINSKLEAEKQLRNFARSLRPGLQASDGHVAERIGDITKLPRKSIIMLSSE